jgi:hypothetical protein
MVPWSRVIFEKLTVALLVKKFPVLPEGLLPCSQESGPHPRPDSPSPHPRNLWSRGSSVSIVSDYGLDDQGSIPDRGRGFFF